MSDAHPSSDSDWVAGILAVSGAALGGVVVSERAASSFISVFAKASGVEKPFRQLPATLSPEIFTGSLDLAATLALGKPVRSNGLLDADGVARLMIRRAEALDAANLSHMATMLDEQRAIIVAVSDARDEEQMSLRLADRLAFAVDQEVEGCWAVESINAAQARLSKIVLLDKHIDDCCQAAVALGITSPRSVVQACHTARVIAALLGRAAVDDEAMARAARLVLAHRAQRLPASEEEQQQEPPLQQPDQPSEQSRSHTPQDSEVVLEAVRAAIPPHVLQSLAAGLGKRGSGRNVKSSGPTKAKSTRGRRMGSRRSQSLAGQRLDIIATLRNAAPWQALRKRAVTANRMIVTRDDFQVHRIKQRNLSTAIFVVDASGSTAFQRLAEAKGAVEAILAECYVRRDKVALISFRSKTAEELLPPTRSLERARRALSALPGGGGTPLACALDKAMQMADLVKRGDASPIVIILTDGRANVTRDGEGNKVKALQESESAARAFAALSIQAMVIDVSPDPQRHARELAANMQAQYLSMPRAHSADIARPVTQALRQKR